MEKIWQAVERARTNVGPVKPQRLAKTPSLVGPQFSELDVNPAYLLSKRIVSYDGADHRSRPYDMLRTQVLHLMDEHGWKVLGVTSPTPGCGKTVTAINLAFSISRQENQSVVLVDVDLRKPQVANYLGVIPGDRGVLDILDRRVMYRDALLWACAANQRIAVLPTADTRQSAERMSSRAMISLLQDLKGDYHIVLLDLPPTLSSDDVISILPLLDCVLLVSAAGQSKAADIQESLRHLGSTPMIRIVLNKAADEPDNYYY
jgi:protein-tyrosine kinase